MYVKLFKKIFRTKVSEKLENKKLGGISRWDNKAKSSK